MPGVRHFATDFTLSTFRDCTLTTYVPNIWQVEMNLVNYP